MAEDYPFGLFAEEEKGPIFRDFCADEEEARKKAQEGADREGLPFLIFSFIKVRQIGRYKPKAHQPPRHESPFGPA